MLFKHCKGYAGLAETAEVVPAVRFMSVPTAPEVSVVMTTFNVASFVGEAIRSALQQTLRSIEIIVMDDGSTDATTETVRRFDDPRIQLIEGPHMGRCRALNTAVQRARGEFVALLDGDDVWHPEKLALQVAYLHKHHQVDLTFSWYQIIDENGAQTGLTSRRWRGPISFRQLLKDNVIGNGSSVVARRDCFLKVGWFDEHIGGCFDYEASLRIALLRPGNLVCVPAYLTYYRRRSGQITGNLSAMEQSYNQLLAKMFRLAPKETAGVAAAARSNMSRFFAYVAYESRDFGQANRYLRRGFRQAPFRFVLDLRNWKMGLAIAAAAHLPQHVYRRLLRIALRPR